MTKFFTKSALLAAAILLVLLAAACGNNANTNKGGSTEPAPSAGTTGNAGENGKEAAAGYPKEIRIGYQVSPNGELMAKALGLAEKKFPDTKITWLKFESGRDVNTAIVSGSIDFGLLGTPPGASGVAQGLPDEIYLYSRCDRGQRSACRPGSIGYPDAAGSDL